MTIETIRSFVAKHKGEGIPTAGNNTTFKVAEQGDSLAFELTSGKIRTESFSWVKKSLVIFNSTGSTQLNDYSHSMNVSYVVGLFRAVSNATPENELLADIEAIEKNPDYDETTRKTLIETRIGQGKYRKALLSNWGMSCAVTESTTLSANRASHIKPWRLSSKDERLDPANGLPLIANLDALFDAGLITFSGTGDLLTSPCLSSEEREIFDLDGLHLRHAPSKDTANYLAYHRDNLFLKEELIVEDETGTI